eukprot:CAMPEP_0181249790 /NCGR_PEP_ID=MMETSP1096-20121128/45961_1 /TAXON_ID=156174 ORGANISM="Chrysochromulina ericina, Strain CCMP281" /NCGR_SAMPLE_ID=MMETSP1096 /ASSEMBLY_ACC=CAM_ASM_000453 /LENGTH=62 /DNA_ID=CAMNT_0023347189 /DNA_START=331 /DNA_END=519 /DNA_ORIENTATION=-
MSLICGSVAWKRGQPQKRHDTSRKEAVVPSLLRREYANAACLDEPPPVLWSVTPMADFRNDR